jgi:hypothetical protein
MALSLRTPSGACGDAAWQAVRAGERGGQGATGEAKARQGQRVQGSPGAPCLSAVAFPGPQLRLSLHTLFSRAYSQRRHSADSVTSCPCRRLRCTLSPTVCGSERTAVEGSYRHPRMGAWAFAQVHILKFEGYNNPEEAFAGLVGCMLLVDAADRPPLQDDEDMTYYVQDLIGMHCINLVRVHRRTLAQAFDSIPPRPRTRRWMGAVRCSPAPLVLSSDAPEPAHAHGAVSVPGAAEPQRRRASARPSHDGFPAPNRPRLSPSSHTRHRALGGAQRHMVPIRLSSPGKRLHHQRSSSSHDASPHPRFAFKFGISVGAPAPAVCPPAQVTVTVICVGGGWGDGAARRHEHRSRGGRVQRHGHV